MDQNYALFDLNKKSLQCIFKKHLGREKKLNMMEFQKFCKIARICPELISIAQFRTVVSKIANTISISKVCFSYDEFERALKEIALMSEAGPISERVKAFFSHIVPRCQSKYGVEFEKKEPQPIIRRHKKSNDSSRSQLEESGTSLVLDLNIKEALETLKLNDSMRSTSISPGRMSDQERPRSRNLSLSGIRSEGGSPSTKFFMSPRNSLKPIKTFCLPLADKKAEMRSSKTLPTNAIDGNKLPTEHVELDEFIQTEQSILNEVATVTVSLAKQKRQKVLDIDLSKVTKDDDKSKPMEQEDIKLERSSSLEANQGFVTKEMENEKKAILDQIKKISPIRDSIVAPAPDPEQANDSHKEKVSSLESMKFLLEGFKAKPNVKRVLKPKPIKTIYRGFDNFITTERKSTFSKDFVLRMIIRAWQSEVAKSKSVKVVSSQARPSIARFRLKK